MYRWLGVLLVAPGLSGCRLADAPPDLLTVADVVPRDAELGDHVEVLGTGFPEGATGTVTFRGDIHQPGTPLRQGMVITIPSTRTLRDRVTFTVSDMVQNQFCGRDSPARHATFRGELMVAFSPRRAGAPLITGRLRDVVMDIDGPPLPDEVLHADQLESQRLLRFVGLTLEEKEEGHRLQVQTVLPSSRADWAGLKSGDLLLELNGVRLRSPDDLLLQPGQRSTAVLFKRGRLPDPIRRDLEVDGFEPTPSPELRPVAVVVGLAVAIVAAFVAPVGRLLAWVARRVSLRLQGHRVRRGTSSKRRNWAASLLSNPWLEELVPEGLGWSFRIVPYLLFIGVGAVTAVMALGGKLCADDLDVALVVLVSATGLLTTGLLMAGSAVERGWSLWSGLRMAAALGAFQVPVVAALTSGALAAGSLRPLELVQRQGAWPWQWLAFRDPVMLLSFLLLLVATLPNSSERGSELAEADPEGPLAAKVEPIRRPKPIGRRGSFTRGLMFTAEAVHLCLMAGLAALVFLGGFAVPGLDLPGTSAPRSSLFLGWVVLELKCWGLVLLLLWLRWTLPRVSADQLWGLALRWLWPLSLGAVLLSWGLRAGSDLPYVQSLHESLTLVTFGASALLIADFARRVLRGLQGSNRWTGVNPWL